MPAPLRSALNMDVTHFSLLTSVIAGLVALIGNATAQCVDSCIATNLTPTGRPRTSTTGDRTPLYISGLFALAGGGWDGSGIWVAVEIALEHINADPSVLADYELHVVGNDARCDAGLGTRVFFEQIRLPPQKLMLIGPACSPTAQAVAQTSAYWNLITVSYSAASSALSNRVVFPYFYRTYMPDAMLNRARVRIIKDHGWRRVATIHENQDLFSLAVNDMINLLKMENITVISSESFDEDPTNQVANLKALDARIIIVNMYESKARRVMCEASRQGMIGPGYVWFNLGWWSHRWWTLEDQYVTKCTTAETSAAVERSFYIGVESALFGEDDAKTISGITPLDFDRELRRRLKLPGYEAYTYNGIASYGYDAAWAIALALNESAEVLKTKRFSDGSIRRLEDFTYDDKEMSQLFFDVMDKTKFYGVSGPVSFLGADRISVTQIEQFRAGCWPNWIEQDGHCYLLVKSPAVKERAAALCFSNDDSQLVSIGTNQTKLEFLEKLLRKSNATDWTKWLIGSAGDFNSSSSASSSCLAIDISNDPATITEVNCSSELPYVCQDDIEFLEVLVGKYDTANDVLTMNSDFVWPGGQVPPDRTHVDPVYHVEVYVGIDLAIFICYSSLAGLGILLSIAFLAFNIHYRSLRIVRMSSPNLNNIILLGTALVYSSVVFYGVDKNLVPEEYLVLFCHIRVWVIAVGFVLAFGAMFSKTWRVHKVVARKTPKRKVVQDKQLVAMVALMLLIDILILLPWQLFFPWREDKTYLQQKVDPDNSTVMLVPYILTCTGDRHVYWSIGLCAFKGLLLLFGAFLAWETRQVRIPALNDSKLIGISVYNVVILCIVGLAINLVLSADPQTLYIFNSSISIFCTTLTILVIFLPKVFTVLKNPNEDPMRETAFGNASRASHDTDNSRQMSLENQRLRQKAAELEKHLKELQSNGNNSGTANGHNHHITEGPSSALMRKRTCNLGMWCCGLICGCSPAEIVHTTGKGDGIDCAGAAHVNEVDLSLELRPNTPSTSSSDHEQLPRRGRSRSRNEA